MKSVLCDQRGSMTYNLLLGLVLTVGISLSIPIIANYYSGREFDPDNPLGGTLGDKVYQSKTIADLRSMATALTGYFLKAGRYPEQLAQIEEAGYLDGYNPVDMWGNDWVYHTDGRHFVLVSLGADGRRGPEPPDPWEGDSYEPDLIIRDGEWIQMPHRPGLKGISAGLARQQELARKTETATRGLGARD